MADPTGGPRARLMALSPARQAQLLDPAEAEFAAHGFAGASLNRILAAAGMSKGQAYYYIKDKADLYGAVIERAFRRLVTKLDFTFGTPPDAKAFWDGVDRLFRRVSEVLLQDPALAALASGLYESEATRAALPGGFLREGFARLVAIGRAVGAVRGDLPDSLFMTMLFAMGLEADRWFAQHWQELEEAEVLRLNREVVGMFRRVAAPQV